jgi:hypothetical protein
MHTALLTNNSIRWGDSRRGTRAEVVQSWVLDDNCGPAYSVVAADLTGAGNGQPTHLLVTSHECLYDHRMLGDAPAAGGLIEGVEEISVGNRAGGNGGGGALFAYEIPQKWRVYPRVYPR